MLTMYAYVLYVDARRAPLLLVLIPFALGSWRAHVVSCVRLFAPTLALARLDRRPFKRGDPNRLHAIFLEKSAARDTIA